MRDLGFVKAWKTARDWAGSYQKVTGLPCPDSARILPEMWRDATRPAFTQRLFKPALQRQPKFDRLGAQFSR